MSQNPRLSVSSWSLHRTLGRPEFYGAALGEIPQDSHNRGEVTLLGLPERLAGFGIRTLEICHFHLPEVDGGYLAELRGELETHGVELWSLLVDDGDLTHPEHAERDLNWIEGWLGVAEQLGAKNVRVIAGKQPANSETLDQARRYLELLTRIAALRGVRVLTENWFDLVAHPADLLWLLDQLQGDLGLCFDFGNWNGPHKYENLEAIAQYATSCHTKAAFSSEGVLDRDDYVRCLDITRAAGFAGPYTLIFDGPGDEWAGLAAEREVVAPYLV